MDSNKNHVHGHIHKDEFLKAERLTIAGQIQLEAKLRKVPAPGAYDVKPFRVKNVPHYNAP